MVNYIIILIQALPVLFLTCFLFTNFLLLKNTGLNRSKLYVLTAAFYCSPATVFLARTLMFKFIVGVNRQVCSNVRDVTDTVQQNFVFLLFLLR